MNFTMFTRRTFEIFEKLLEVTSNNWIMPHSPFEIIDKLSFYKSAGSQWLQYRDYKNKFQFITKTLLKAFWSINPSIVL